MTKMQNCVGTGSIGIVISPEFINSAKAFLNNLEQAHPGTAKNLVCTTVVGVVITGVVDVGILLHAYLQNPVVQTTGS